MRYILFALALAAGSHAFADGSGQDWTDVPVEQDFDEYYLQDERTIEQNITIINEENIFIDITINEYPEAPLFLPMPHQPPLVQFCYAQNAYGWNQWGQSVIVGWQIYGRLWNGRAILLAYGRGGRQQERAFHNLWQSGQCPNSF